MHVAHDGVRAARFAAMPDREAARATLGWPADACIVGYMGQLHTMGMDKGVALLLDAVAQVPGASLGLVGGPEAMAESLRQRWLDSGRAANEFLYAGQVAPQEVPRCLSAFDICAMPFPRTRHFERYMSPLKLFEYMAARRAILASDLPSVREILRDQETALLVPPSDMLALAAAVTALQDAALRQRLADAAYAEVMAHYTWAQRARMIRQHIEAVSVKA